MVGSSLSGNVPCLLILSADTVFSKIIHAQVSQAGYPARVAGAVSDALTISEHALPALLLVDRRIPDWDMLRTSPLLKSVPLFALAPAEGLYTEEQWVSDLERGADSIYDFRDGDRLFLAKLRASLWRAGYAVTGRAVYQVGAVHLDADRREVTIAGERLQLSDKPFVLLKTLMQAPARVFRRSELVDRVWGPRFAIGKHTLDVHVHTLRRHLDRDPRRRCRLITIKGVGFKLKTADPVPTSAAMAIDGCVDPLFADHSALRKWSRL
jgi:Response regulators consisting of a CheY-like receiver domain and a winged-helix DNA-binding domain